MANVKIVLRKEVKKDGTSPLAIRITKDRKTSYIYLDYSVKQSDWDEAKESVRKSYPNSVRLNIYLGRKKAEVIENALELESNKTDVTAKSVRRKSKPEAGSSVFAQADLYLKSLKDEGKFSRYNTDKSRIKHLKEFLKHDTLFSELNEAVLKRFKSYLKATHNMSERSAINHYVVVRSLFSQAIADKVCDPKYYPFGKGKIKIKFPDSIKVGLTIEEVAALETVEVRKEASHARNVWLISFYFAGMRVSDVLRLTWSDFNDGRLAYKMGKNEKGGSLKVPDKAWAIIQQYEAFKRNKDDVIFPYLKSVDLDNKFEAGRMIAAKTGAIDGLLKAEVAPAVGIDKRLTMHIARHTFAQIAGDRIPIQMLQKLYRHSSIMTTIGYQSNFINKDTDDALDAVLNEKKMSNDL